MAPNHPNTVAFRAGDSSTATRAAGRARRRGEASTEFSRTETSCSWPSALKQVAESEFQQWETDVFMYCSHVIVKEILQAGG